MVAPGGADPESGQPDDVVGSAGLLNGSAGIAPERAIPRFADQPLTAWFAGAADRPARATRGKVVLWPDSFTTYLSPEVGRAAVRVLEAAGFEVVLPDAARCAAG